GCLGGAGRLRGGGPVRGGGGGLRAGGLAVGGGVAAGLIVLEELVPTGVHRARVFLELLVHFLDQPGVLSEVRSRTAAHSGISPQFPEGAGFFATLSSL